MTLEKLAERLARTVLHAAKATNLYLQECSFCSTETDSGKTAFASHKIDCPILDAVAILQQCDCEGFDRINSIR